MTGAQRVRVFHDAVEIMLLRQVQRTKPANPDGYIARTRGLKRRDYQAVANDLFDEHPEIDAEGLANLLEPEPTSAGKFEPINTSALLPNVDDVVPWQPATPADRELGRRRIAEIRELLAKGGEKGEHSGNR